MKAAISCPDSRLLRDNAEQLVGDDERAIKRMLELIAETNRTGLASLQESFKAGCWAEVASAAHRMAGSARMLGHDALIAALSELEMAGRERNRELATTLMPVVADALIHLDKAIEEAVRLDTGAGA
ncbi:Hpt domain-containing protein [Paraburkholderia phenoliruptrix]|uniref:Hpt domain-containing protein n=1 Tax=Paraburkholderia phenoliruptrix TaxID=252970 RepID=UPI001C6F12F1|nr:Hpt domain-containing protein [Paraburkholderia phenoliruptrix]MBW9106961.1 Hpt domain-containing protein [Paraburkholderia phenoliruptrix]MBW9129413.1 Hpt domain-containing protein [Paraburkholderia ginsengiterrae]